jgi:O-antigen/teichoic acid export membrane protein
MGGQFFLIMLCILFIFQFQNIIISRELGAEQVTLYNVTYKIFGIVEMVMMIILTPIWSAYTDAYTRKDFVWMKNSSRRLEQLGLLCIPALFLLWIVSPYLFKLWLGDSVCTSLSVSFAVALFVLSKVWGNIYMYQINGTGKVMLQLITYVFLAFIAIPLMIYLSRS